MSGTGWTWQHARHECDLPMYLALCKYWRNVPPAAIQLRRIAQFLGLKENAQPGTDRMAASDQPSQPSSTHEVAMAAAMAGLPMFEGKPNDPIFDFIPPFSEDPAS